MENDTLGNDEVLRQKAQKLIKMRPLKIKNQLSEAETLNCLYELEVLKVQLELMNAELKQANTRLESLRESEETFKAYLDNSIEVIHTVNSEGKFLFVSSAWESYFGLPVSKAVGQEFDQFVHPDDRHICNEYVQQILKTGQFGKSPAYRVKVANGELRWIVTNGKSFTDRKGELLFIGISHDITDRINAEVALRKSEKQFSLSMDATNDGLWDWDISNNTIYFSPGYFRMLGYEPNEFEPTFETWKNLMHPEDAESAVSNNEDCINNVVTNINVEFRMKAKDGSWHWILGRGKAVERDATGKALRMIGTHVDITARKKIEQALNESEALYRAIINASPYQITMTDTEGRILMFSPAALKLFGYEDGKEILGRYFVDFLVPEDRERAQLGVSLRLQGIKTGPNVYLAQRADGSVFHFETSAELIANSDGQPTQFLIIGRDISKRIKTELEIKLKNEELAKLNAEKDKFFSIISHDLRGPFNGFLGFTEILERDLDNLSTEQIRQIASGMNKSAGNVFKLLQNLLQWARVQQGLIPFVPEVVQLRQIVIQIIELIIPSARNKDILITNHIRDETLVFADFNMLQSILSNLISNAVKFTTKGGRISLSAKNCPDKTIEVSVTDSGIGISQGMKEDLFRIDKRTNRPGTEGESSCGLGLILCKEFVEKQGGKIWVESEPQNPLTGKDGGSTFYFTLPLAQAET